MLLRPTASSGVPVYVQLMEQVAHAVRTGALRPGDALPGAHRLAEELVVHPAAVTRAYQGLRDRGVVTFGERAEARVAADGHRRSAYAASARMAVAPGRDITRELESAREVQQRLLPQEYPSFRGVDYAGVSRPALGVGGDYFDFIRLSETELGLAIGDVCGKGMPAALLMATLRASLRSETRHHDGEVLEVVANLNRLVHESCASNRFASFFYGKYDASSRTLRYVNAGHNPPFIVRTTGGTPRVLRLDCGGPVIGLMRDSVYTEGRLVLEPGDLLVAYTDGITEAMNAADAEWGEEELLRAIADHRTLPARELVARIMECADAFAAGAPQHDDMTAVAARVA
jgi:phosphoserine phosphatase RsbU/P